MTMVIKKLSNDASSRIAAGEVVERPASVVRELVDNALDAGAKNVTVEIKRGGVELIKVTDDGHGISNDEVALAFERFATSKLDSDQDLEGVQTLGFRGEALPSIASVANVVMQTRDATGEFGTYFVADYGEVIKSEPRGRVVGTSVSVRGLFKNTPARLKFLSSAVVETNRVQSLMAGYILINPAVKFTLVIDNATRFISKGDGDYKGAVEVVYGGTIADSMLTMAGETDGSAYVRGLISSIEVKRRNRNYIVLAVNGRRINNRRLVTAVTQGYRDYLGELEFPIVVLDIVVPYEDVDVNIHPAKSEVRFKDDNLIFSMLMHLIQKTLRESSLVPSMGHNDVGGGSEWENGANGGGEHGGAGWTGNGVALGDRAYPAVAADGEMNGDGMAPTLTRTHHSLLSGLKFIGQARLMYLVTESDSDIYLIDQHAAHERVMYEKTLYDLQNSLIERQQLLSADVVELPPEYGDRLERLAELEEFGFTVERFGDNAVIVRAVPRLAIQQHSMNANDLIKEILDQLTVDEKGDSWRNGIAATIACHSSIRAGRKVGAEEALKLFESLDATEQPQTCPHGRPTMIHLPSEMLDKRFGRI